VEKFAEVSICAQCAWAMLLLLLLNEHVRCCSHSGGETDLLKTNTLIECAYRALQADSEDG
jgi:hypothetical protein